MKEMATTATQTHEGVVSETGALLLRIAFRVSFIMTVGIVALFGLWAVASLMGGAVAAGGPLGLVKGWFSAVLGF